MVMCTYLKIYEYLNELLNIPYLPISTEIKRHVDDLNVTSIQLSTHPPARGQWMNGWTLVDCDILHITM